jgi:hypothetical protein
MWIRSPSLLPVDKAGFCPQALPDLRAAGAQEGKQTKHLILQKKYRLPTGGRLTNNHNNK